ncbi:hypothetical protein CTA1_11867 [Colletotrichum tanaceti]|uniref:PD-(D/E)XK nuclease-like domain-containing protein n=1 Tax=Colletotrichum tanaceti TaxID=1306861 RepID=A0A4U6XIK5_9PEZI|nr:hypothetical protein CTA1_11867 [Colletotrichum tanaceti]
MPYDSIHRVYSWLEDLPLPAFPNPKPVRTVLAARSKRRRTPGDGGDDRYDDHNSDDHGVNHDPRLPSPPLSDSTPIHQMPLETPKKRKTAHVDAPAEPLSSTNQDETPRQPPRQYELPPPPSTASSQDDATSATSGALDASSVRSGNASPSRLLSTLSLQSDGVQVRSMDIEDAQMPDALVSLVNTIDMVALGQQVVPAQLKAEVAALRKTSRSLASFHDFVYQEAARPNPDHDDDDDDDDAPNCADTPPNVTVKYVLDIVGEAKYFFDSNQDEAGWNSLAHTSILRAALGCHRENRLVTVTPCFSATVIPRYRIGRVPGRKVDYVLSIEPANDASDGPAAVAAVTQLRLRLDEESISHTSFLPLSSRPISVSIETKRGGDHEKKAQLQMGVWQAAQWKMLSQQVDAQALAQLAFIPGVVIQGHQWRLVATTYRDHKTTLWTARQFGSTETPLGTFQAIAGLQVLQHWTGEVYWPWYKRNVLKLQGTL